MSYNCKKKKNDGRPFWKFKLFEIGRQKGPIGASAELNWWPLDGIWKKAEAYPENRKIPSPFHLSRPEKSRCTNTPPATFSGTKLSEPRRERGLGLSSTWRTAPLFFFSMEMVSKITICIWLLISRLSDLSNSSKKTEFLGASISSQKTSSCVAEMCYSISQSD